MSALSMGSPEILDIRARLARIKRSFADAARARLPSPMHAEPLSDDRLQRLLEICHPDSCDNPWKTPYRQRNFLIVLMMATLGVRRGELLKLRVSDCHLARTIPEIRIQRSPDDPADPRINEPQVKTESRHLPCEASLARYLNEYICRARRQIPGANRSPFLFLSRRGEPMSLVRVNGLLDQVLLFILNSMICARTACAAHAPLTSARQDYEMGWMRSESTRT